MSAPSFRCPACGHVASAEDEEPLTYFELVPRWQSVRAIGERLVVSFECSFGDDGDQAFLRCNRCDHLIDDVPPLVFEGQADESFSGAACDAPSTSTTEGIST